jgi:hypothetical protein
MNLLDVHSVNGVCSSHLKTRRLHHMIYSWMNYASRRLGSPAFGKNMCRAWKCSGDSIETSETTTFSPLWAGMLSDCLMDPYFLTASSWPWYLNFLATLWSGISEDALSVLVFTYPLNTARYSREVHQWLPEIYLGRWIVSEHEAPVSCPARSPDFNPRVSSKENILKGLCNYNRYGI